LKQVFILSFFAGAGQSDAVSRLTHCLKALVKPSKETVQLCKKDWGTQSKDMLTKGSQRFILRMLTEDKLGFLQRLFLLFAMLKSSLGEIVFLVKDARCSLSFSAHLAR
jgi:hypothetical protein